MKSEKLGMDGNHGDTKFTGDFPIVEFFDYICIRV